MIGLILFQFFGKVGLPPGVDKYKDFDAAGGGIILLMNNLLKLSVVIAGLFTMVNFIIAGYAFFSAGGDSKKIAEASAKIWQSIVGLLIVAGSFVLAAIIGLLIFKDATAIIVPKIYTP